MAILKDKPAKKPCKINLSIELAELIEYKCKLEHKFTEEVFKDAIIQLINPRIGEIGMGHPDFKFLAPLMKSPDVKDKMFWLVTKLWEQIKEIRQNHRVSLHVITYTAIYNHMQQYKHKE